MSRPAGWEIVVRWREAERDPCPHCRRPIGLTTDAYFAATGGLCWRHTGYPENVAACQALAAPPSAIAAKEGR